MSLTIERADNGYICRDTGERHPEDTVPPAVNVFEDREEKTIFPECDADSAVAMLWHVVEFFDLYGSKHGGYRIKIEAVQHERDSAEEGNDDASV